jgi:hypothetical protein
MKQGTHPEGQAHRLDTCNANANQDLVQQRFNKALKDPYFSWSKQRRRVCQHIIDHPCQLTHQLNRATSCGNISHVVTVKCRETLIKHGIAMFCYYPHQTPHFNQYDEKTDIHRWCAVPLEEYDADRYGDL